MNTLLSLIPAVCYFATPLILAALGELIVERAGIVNIGIEVLIWGYLRFTRSGLELAAIGESPRAADTAGIAVNRRKWLAILFGAACAGLAGAYLSIMYNRSFTENMTDGVGFLALAMVIFGRWNAGGIIMAGLFFGLVRAMANTLETRVGFSPAVLRAFGMLPYVVSLAALAGVAGKSGAPAALGRAYVRE
jgi:ABC-type uncharacterized transport system permease subunit